MFLVVLALPLAIVGNLVTVIDNNIYQWSNKAPIQIKVSEIFNK